MRELSIDLIYRVWDTYLAEIGGTDDANAVRLPPPTAPPPHTHPHARPHAFTSPHAHAHAFTSLQFGMTYQVAILSVVSVVSVA